METLNDSATVIMTLLYSSTMTLPTWTAAWEELNEPQLTIAPAKLQPKQGCH